MNWKIIRIIDEYAGIPLIYLFFILKKIFRVRSGTPADRSYKKILLVKFWGIGNLFMMLPSVDGLRRTYPGAEIDLLTLETSRLAAACMGGFGNIYTIDTKSYFRFFLTSFSILRTLRQNDYDCIIDFEQFARFSALCLAMTGKRETVGFMTAGQHRHSHYTRAVAYNNNIHVMESYCFLVRAAGVESDCRGVPLRPQGPALTGRTESRILRRLGIGGDGPLVTLHVGTSSNFSERRWPAASYAVLADLLRKNHGAEIVLTGLADEGFIASGITGMVRSMNGIIDASGKMTFDEYLELISLSDLVVSADTAAVHVASAVGTPVVGLYGPNTPLLYGPWGENSFSFYKELPCSPCITNFNAKTNDCRHPEGKGACMSKITAEEVYEEIRKRYFDGASAGKFRKTSGVVTCAP